jgi:hypothetical protein
MLALLALEVRAATNRQQFIISPHLLLHISYLTSDKHPCVDAAMPCGLCRPVSVFVCYPPPPFPPLVAACQT